MLTEEGSKRVRYDLIRAFAEIERHLSTARNCAALLINEHPFVRMDEMLEMQKEDEKKPPA